MQMNFKHDRYYNNGSSGNSDNLYESYNESSGLDDDRRPSLTRARAKIINFSAQEISGASTSQSGGEQRPTKFPVKNELDVVLRKVRSVLNKISSINYTKLQNRWVNLIPTEPDQLTEVFQLLIAKALDDSMYMKIYARLIRDVLDENPSNSNSLRSSLYNQLHHGLQGLTTDMELAKCGRLVERENEARRRRVMLYRFIAELYMQNVCSTRFVTERVTDLIGQGRKLPQDADEPLECICVILMFAGSKLEEYKGCWLNDVFVNLNLTDPSKIPIVSKRMHFMLLDLMEMRANGWAAQSKWWVQQVPTTSDTTIDAELSSLIASRSKSVKSRRSKKNATNSRRLREKERTLRTILNQVVPSNLDRMAFEFGQIFQRRRNSTDASVTSIINHILHTDDPMFIRVQSELISKVCNGCPVLKAQLSEQLLQNLGSIPTIRFCAELYIMDVLSLGEILSSLQRNPIGGIESACIFFNRVQFKLFRIRRKIQVHEKIKMETLIESMNKNARLHCPHRIRCMVLDIDDLQNAKWEGARPLLWNPISLCKRTMPFTFQNAINVFNANAEDGLEFMQENLGTNRRKIQRFVENLCIWAIWNSNSDLLYLVTCGRFIKSIMRVQLLSAKQFQPILASVVHGVTLMKDKPDAWAHLGQIMHELYKP